jgi:hypothetical protein
MRILSLKITVVLLVGLSTQIFCAEEKSDQDKQFVEQKLFVEPRETESIWGGIAKWVPPLVLFGFNYNSIKDVFKEVASKKFTTATHILLPSYCIGVIGLAFYLSNRFISKPLNFRANRKKAFLDFLHNWPIYKERTPQELHYIFDDLCIKINQQGFTDEDIEKIVPQALNNIRSTLTHKNTLEKTKKDRYVVVLILD